MKEKTIHGVFEYNDKRYPFSLDGRILTIPQIPFQYKDEFNEVAHIAALYGVTNGNQGIRIIPKYDGARNYSAARDNRCGNI